MAHGNNMKKNGLRITLALVFAALITAFFAFDLHHYVTLDAIKTQQQSLQHYYADNTLMTATLFMLAYIAVTALSLPVATPLTLLAGALFGFIPGLLMVSFASTIGATLAFLMARFMMRDAIAAKYPTQLTKINQGFEKEGIFYLFALRLTPVVPFFLVNVLMSLLAIRTITFYWVSQLGMLTATAVYVYAGTELGNITSLADIASPSLITAFIALGLFPLIAKKALTFIREKKAHA